MIRGLYTAATGMITRQAQQENLSNNIANINTPGYKQDKITTKSFEELVIENRDKLVGGKAFKNVLGSMEFGVGIEKTTTNFEQGIIQETGRNLDFALDGENIFFTLQDMDGNIKYTRDGRFSIKEIDGKGYMVSSQGYFVLGGDSNPINLDNSDIVLSNDGSITTSDGSQVKFNISRFSDGKSLIKSEGNYFVSDVEPEKVNGSVKQKSLEKSNVDVIDTITEMISIMRSYESSQKVIQQMDETLGKTVNEVGSIR